jgi:hypothetical protein
LLPIPFHLIFLLYFLILFILPCFKLLILKARHRQDILKEVIKEYKGIKLHIAIIAIIHLKGLPDTLDDHLGNVHSLMINKVDLHHLKFFLFVAFFEDGCSSARRRLALWQRKLIDCFGRAILDIVGADYF